MNNNEIELQITDFNEFNKFLSIFAILQPAAQITFTKTGLTVFGKFVSGRCDLYSNSIGISNMAVDAPESTTVFVSDLKKFLYALEMVGKYYDVSDPTPFLTREVKFFVSLDSSYFRIESAKYSVKYQLSSNAVVQNSVGASSSYSITASKYSTTAHKVFSENGKILDDIPFLIAFKTSRNNMSAISSFLNVLANPNDAKIKIELPEQTAVEQDLSNSDSAMATMPNTLYAVLSDNQRLVQTKLGNKVCVVAGNITKLDPDYGKICKTDSTKKNFVYLLSVDQLKLMNSVLASFESAPVKKVKKSKKAKDSEEAEQQPNSTGLDEAGNIEVGISKVNIMHFNLISTGASSTSEFYISFVGEND